MEKHALAQCSFIWLKIIYCVKELSLSLSDCTHLYERCVSGDVLREEGNNCPVRPSLGRQEGCEDASASRMASMFVSVQEK